MDLLGIKQSNPWSHKPSFSNPVVREMYNATRNKVNDLIRKYDSLEALRKEIHSPQLFIEVTKPLMGRFAHRIWGCSSAVSHNRLCEGELDHTIEEDRKR